MTPLNEQFTIDKYRLRWTDGGGERDATAAEVIMWTEIERLQRELALLIEIDKSIADALGVEDGQSVTDRIEELIVTEVGYQNLQQELAEVRSTHDTYLIVAAAHASDLERQRDEARALCNQHRDARYVAENDALLQQMPLADLCGFLVEAAAFRDMGPQTNSDAELMRAAARRLAQPPPVSLLREALHVVIDCQDCHTQPAARGEYLGDLLKRLEAATEGTAQPLQVAIPEGFPAITDALLQDLVDRAESTTAHSALRELQMRRAAQPPGDVLKKVMDARLEWGMVCNCICQACIDFDAAVKAALSPTKRACGCGQGDRCEKCSG